MPPSRSRPNVPGHEYVVLEENDYDGTTTPVDGRIDPLENDEAPEDLYDFYDKLLEPTELELKTLRRISGHIPWQAYSVAFVELCERFSWYGTTAVCE